MTEIIGYILAIIFLVLWRLDIHHAARERRDLIDRLQAGSLPAYDAHKERVAEQANPKHSDIEADLYDEDERPPFFTDDELEQLREDIQHTRIRTAQMLSE